METVYPPVVVVGLRFFHRIWGVGRKNRRGLSRYNGGDCPGPGAMRFHCCQRDLSFRVRPAQVFWMGDDFVYRIGCRAFLPGPNTASGCEVVERVVVLGTAARLDS